MRKSIGYSIAALCILIVLAASTAPAVAADYTKVGVKVGDTATYRTSQTGSTINKTVHIIHGIVGTTLYVNWTDYLPNGAVSTKDQVVGNIVTGSNSITTYVMAKNLTVGDPIFSGSTSKINDSSTMTFAGASRTVNHLSLFNGSWQWWWDRDTGLIVKQNVWFFIWRNMTMISTTAWSAPTPSGLFDNPLMLPLLGMGALAVVLLVGIVIVARRKK